MQRKLRNIVRTLCIGAVCACGALQADRAVQAQLDFEQAPIEYGKKPASDRVTKLAKAVESGQVQLKYDPAFGYLPALLEALDIPQESQTLVFSKTSFQIHKINAFKPRAIYFNDDTYVGYVRGSDTLELGASDAEQGGIFFTLEGPADEKPRLIRDQGQCLICHGSVRTQGVPGFLVRSIISDSVGHPVTGTPTFVTDHTSPFSERWGGWYVTGTHGEMQHLGNVMCRDPNLEGWVDRKAGANRKELPEAIHPDRYLQPSSDITALMVLEHQTQMHNLMTRAAFEARTAAYQDSGINEALDRPADYQSESTVRRINSVTEKLLKYMLMADEIELTAPVVGSSQFAAKFSARGPQDAKGHSLYQLDLQKHLFKTPCSFLVYSEAFDGLPETVKQRLGARLHEVLVKRDNDAGYERLSAEDRDAVVDVLSSTKKEFWDKYAAQGSRVELTSSK
ncbi:MAG: hypothetical protein U0892_17765 [Pirellulales bacterium]